MNAILVAYDGRRDMLRVIFGGDSAPKNMTRPIRDRGGEPVVLTAALFDRMFAPQRKS